MVKPNTDYRLKVVEFSGAENTINYLIATASKNAVDVHTPYAEKIQASEIVTPNGDGKNDFWKVGRIEMLKDFDLYVYNNIGEIIYQTKAYDNQWNVEYNGNKLPSGTYYYMFINTEDKKTYKGTITIIVK